MKKIQILVISIIALVIIIAGVIVFYIISSLQPLTLSNEFSVSVTNSSSPSFVFTSSKAGTISYSGKCESPTISVVKGTNTIVFDKLSDGNYTDCAITITAGGKTSSINIPDFVVDSTPPVTTANLNGYANGAFAQSVTINLTYSDSLSGCDGSPHYEINNKTEQIGNSITLNNEGIYSIIYWSVDKAGNAETVHAELDNIRIYSTAPTISINTSGMYRNQSFNITYTPSNYNDSCYYKVNSGVPQDYGACNGMFNDINFPSDNHYIIIVYENNSVGKIGYDTISINWDTTSPSISISFPSSGGTYSQATWQNVSLDYDDSIECQYSSDGTSWTDFYSCNDTSNYSPASSTSLQTLYIRGIDSAGNSGNDSVSFTYN
jgi:uncharacterized protein involved in high-affinity Fe2+ transport